MRGRRFYRDGGCHPGRLGIASRDLSGREILELKRKIADVLKIQVKPRPFADLLLAVSIARATRDLEQARETRKDTIAELEGMATFGDALLATALARCAPRTCAAIEAAHAGILGGEIERNGHFRDVDGNEWVAPPSLFFGSPDFEKAGIAPHLPAGISTVRTAIQNALFVAINTPDRRGRREHHHLEELSTVCARFFEAHMPNRGWKPHKSREKVSIHVEFAAVVFGVAGFPVTDEHLVDILSRRPSPSLRQKPLAG